MKVIVSVINLKLEDRGSFHRFAVTTRIIKPVLLDFFRNVLFFIVAFYSVCKYIFTVHKITSNYKWLHTFYSLIVTVKKLRRRRCSIHRFWLSSFLDTIVDTGFSSQRLEDVLHASVEPTGALWDSPINFHLNMLNIYYNYFFYIFMRIS